MKKRFLRCLMLAVVLVFSMAVNAQAEEVNPEECYPYIIEEGTVYYASSENFGSGRYGIVSPENPYTTTPCYAGICGYSFLDASGNIISSDYQEDEIDIFIPEPPENTVQVEVHFRTFFQNGWCDQKSVKPNPHFVGKTGENENPDENIGGVESGETIVPELVIQEEEKTPEIVVDEIMTEIEEELSKPMIVIDYSGSMSDNQKQVVDLLTQMDLKNSDIIVFAGYAISVTAEEFENRHFDVYPGATDLYEALNKATFLCNRKIILISDLGDNCGTSLVWTDKEIELVIYDPDDNGEWDSSVLEYIRSHLAKSKVIYNHIKE